MKTLKWPDSRNAGVIKPGLERVYAALEVLGNPQLLLPPVVHVAGTNGKGSTIAFLRAILEAAGKKCHVYTSPHLVEFNERIVVAGEQISDEMLEEVLEETRKKCDSMGLTFFEATTVAAFVAFAKVKADFVLLETGLGGRLDATNVIERPAVTIITPIAMDHMEFLGESIEQIAFEKAGIMKKGVSCVAAQQKQEVMEVLKTAAAEKGAMLVEAGDGGDLPHPALHGKHQYINAVAAAAAAKILGISNEYIRKGIGTAKWHARMQKLSEGLYLDGGHNVAAAEIIRDVMLEEKQRVGGSNIAILGMMRRKDIAGFLTTLQPAIDAVYAVSIEGEDCYSAQEIAAECGKLGVDCKAFSNAQEALNAPRPKGSTVICGSLYLAGEVLEL